MQMAMLHLGGILNHHVQIAVPVKSSFLLSLWEKRALSEQGEMLLVDNFIFGIVI